MVLFTFACVVIIVSLVAAVSNAAEAKRKKEEKLRLDIERALRMKDVDELKRIRVMQFDAIDNLDRGLRARLDTVIDELYIEQDERNHNDERQNS